MKFKKVVLVGVVLMLVSLTGCTEQLNFIKGNSDNIVSFEELGLHLAKYIGQNVTIEGCIGLILSEQQVVIYDSHTNPRYAIILRMPSNIKVYTGMYRIEGVVGEGSAFSYIASIEVSSATPI